MSKTGYIYKLVCNDIEIKEIYVGSTQNFRTRKYQHKTSCNKPQNVNHNHYVYQFIRANGGFENWDMVEVEQYQYENKRELHSRERHYIEQLQAKLNKTIPARTCKEWHTKDRLENPEKNKQISKKSKNNNKEKIQEYTLKNKENRKVYHKGYRTKNKLKIKNTQDKYRARSWDAIAEKKKEDYKKKKDKLNEPTECECGASIVRCVLLRHMRSKKHQFYIQYRDYLYS